MSNISFTKIIGVNTSPNCFFSISFGFKHSVINSNNSFGLSNNDINKDKFTTFFNKLDEKIKSLIYENLDLFIRLEYSKRLKKLIFIQI